MNVAHITPLLITYNEAANIGRTLDRLTWARRIVVIDSGSTDETLDLVGRYPQAEIVHRPFDSFARQCNFGLQQIESEWVLSLDSDYVLSEGLVAELQTVADNGAAGYRAAFRYCIGGRPLRRTLYPPRTVLYRHDKARYEDDGHGHRVRIDGEVRSLAHPIFHDDRKPLARWLRNQGAYARLEVEKLRTTPRDRLSRIERLRLQRWIMPLVTPFYCLFGKGLILDGSTGLTYTLQRTYYEVVVALTLMDNA
jgi:glycosyltransferase involved in cell wall biosynthesis